MTTANIIRTVIEVAVVFLVAYMIYREDAIARFEHRLFRAVKAGFNRYLELREQAREEKSEQHPVLRMAVDNSSQYAERSECVNSVYIAG